MKEFFKHQGRLLNAKKLDIASMMMADGHADGGEVPALALDGVAPSICMFLSIATSLKETESGTV